MPRNANKVYLGRCGSLDAGVLAPGEEGVNSQLGPITADHLARSPAKFGDDAKLASNPGGLSKSCRRYTRNSPPVIVDHIQHAEPSATGHKTGRVVERPALVGLGWVGHWRSRSKPALAATRLAHGAAPRGQTYGRLVTCN